MGHLASLRKAHHRLLLRYNEWKRKPRDGYRMLAKADALAKTGCEIAETLRKRRTIVAGFVIRMDNERPP